MLLVQGPHYFRFGDKRMGFSALCSTEQVKFSGTQLRKTQWGVILQCFLLNVEKGKHNLPLWSLFPISPTSSASTFVAETCIAYKYLLYPLSVIHPSSQT